MNRFSSIALKLLSSYYRRRRQFLPVLATDLFSARFYVPLEQWLSRATLYSLEIALFCLLFAVMIGLLFFRHLLIWSTLSQYPLSLTDFIWLIAQIAIVLAVVLVSFTSSFAIFAYYPRLRGWERRQKIDGHLPYAIVWMSTMASVGVLPYVIFKKLAEAKGYFGEVSGEASLVVRDVEVLGYDFISALRNLVNTSPSTQLRAFVQGAVTNALAGGDMGEYFVSKGRETMSERQKKFGDFIQALGLVAELYISGLVAAPLFIIVLYTAMMMLRGASPLILMAIIYLFLPLGSMLFLLVTDTLTPEGRK